MVNRVFHLKALRHWGFQRPWEKLWVVFNPEDLTQDEEDRQLADRAVVEVQQRLHSDVYGSQLLNFHPVVPRQLNARVDFCPLAACGGEPWGSLDQIMETVCGHLACVNCMIGYWENHVRNLGGATPGDWPCPYCRQSPGKLRTRINIAQTQGLGAEFDQLTDILAL
ncbi:Zinc finger, RING/FYVE/PHD-type [Lasallia pustulata]|uniref:Zinc finger, RING/FYVE/PHD-type n=1 Tax=Lasallia pustulata TaxID=136370 RepID=A0A1W5D2S6_9LECA|nr:Zinc finger, RING/FYVE/PHD-type [Lasallia pustulata]